MPTYTTNLQDLLVDLLTDHERQVGDWMKREREQEPKVNRRAGEILCQRSGLRSKERLLVDRLRKGELTRDDPRFSLPRNCFRVADGELRSAGSVSRAVKAQPPPPRIRRWLHEAVRQAERELGVCRDEGAIPWLGMDGKASYEESPLANAIKEVLKHLKFEGADEDAIRQHVQAVRDGKVTRTNDLSVELARLSEREGFVTKLLDKVGRAPDGLADKAADATSAPGSGVGVGEATRHTAELNGDGHATSLPLDVEADEHAPYFPSSAFPSSVPSDKLANAAKAKHITRQRVNARWHYSWPDAHKNWPNLVQKQPPSPETP